jgi:hypothetical protein
MRRPYPSVFRLQNVSVVMALFCWHGIFLLSILIQRLAYGLNLRHNIYDVSNWGVSGLEVDSFMHEVQTFDRHLPACIKVDIPQAIFICTLMQAAYARPSVCPLIERVVEKTLYSDYAETVVDWCKVLNHVVKLRIHYVPSSCIFQRDSFVQNFKSSIYRFLKFLK